jgi:hypothetical protein
MLQEEVRQVVVEGCGRPAEAQDYDLAYHFSLRECLVKALFLLYF